MTIGIYKIENLVDGKFYIGSSNNIERRWVKHKADLKSQRHRNCFLQRAWNKHGSKNFNFSIVEEVDLLSLTPAEQSWLDKTACYDNSIGYNIAKEANTPTTRPGIKLTQEHRQKISISLKGRTLGRVLTKEHRLKISHNQFGRIQSEETRLKIGLGQKGKKVSDETRKLQSEAMVGNSNGRKFTDEEESVIVKEAYAVKGMIVKTCKKYSIYTSTFYKMVKRQKHST